MTIRIIAPMALVAAGVLLLASCGGGGGGMSATSTMPPVMPSPQLEFSSDEGLAYNPLGFPYSYDSESPYYLVGGDGLMRTVNGFNLLGEWNGVQVAWGRERNGVGRNDLISEIQEDIRKYGYVRRWATPPVVRVAHGTPDYLINLTHTAVAMINTALPPNWQLGFEFQPASAGADPFAPGAILITFGPESLWPNEAQNRDALGVSFTYTDATMVTGPIWIDASASLRAGVLKRIIGHEILHSLGRGHPIDLYDRTDTIMSYDHHDLPQMLFQLDQEMLLAVYGRLQAGTASSDLASDLGPWSDTSTQLVAAVRTPNHVDSPLARDFAFFGVRLMNGRAMPWAAGPEPLQWIWNNQALSGSASWTGRLIGFTPSARPVGGKADMMLDLADLDGTVDFTNLEQWAAGRAPSAPGTGIMWGDGDLHYTIQVSSGNGDAFGNYTPGADDDYGILDGGFFGPHHEAVAGVLERDDLTAAFGGSLQ